MSAEILMRDAAVYTGVALSKEDIDRHAAQQTKRKTRAAIRAAQDRGIK
jgi:F0F1-type ATP synthase epsilon subunit